MSRAATGDVVEIKPQSNIYTVLVLIAFLAVLLSFIALYLRAGDVFYDNTNTNLSHNLFS